MYNSSIHSDGSIYEHIQMYLFNDTSQTVCFQVRLIDSLVSQLQFQKGKDAEVAWIDGQIVVRENQMDAKRLSADNEPMDGNQLLYRLFAVVTFSIFFFVQLTTKNLKY